MQISHLMHNDKVGHWARVGSRDLVRTRKLVDLQVRENIEETALPVSNCCFQFAVPAPEPIASKNPRGGLFLDISSGK
jgi:hypothetical protein